MVGGSTQALTLAGGANAGRLALACVASCSTGTAHATGPAVPCRAALGCGCRGSSRRHKGKDGWDSRWGASFFGRFQPAEDGRKGQEKPQTPSSRHPRSPVHPLRPGDDAVIGRLQVLTDDDIRRCSCHDIMATGSAETQQRGIDQMTLDSPESNSGFLFSANSCRRRTTSDEVARCRDEGIWIRAVAGMDERQSTTAHQSDLEAWR